MWIISLIHYLVPKEEGFTCKRSVVTQLEIQCKFQLFQDCILFKKLKQSGEFFHTPNRSKAVGDRRTRRKLSELCFSCKREESFFHTAASLSIVDKPAFQRSHAPETLEKSMEMLECDKTITNRGVECSRGMENLSREISRNSIFGLVKFTFEEKATEVMNERKVLVFKFFAGLLVECENTWCLVIVKKKRGKKSHTRQK